MEELFPFYTITVQMLACIYSWREPHARDSEMKLTLEENMHSCFGAELCL